MILDTTTKSIEVYLGSAKTTYDMAVVSEWADITSSTFTPGSTDTATNGGATVTIVAAPNSYTQRCVKTISIYNADSAAKVATVVLNNNSTKRKLVSCTIEPGYTLHYSSDAGWSIIPKPDDKLSPSTTVITSSSTPTPNADTDDLYAITALAAAATFGAPTGNPKDGQVLLVRIKDDGTTRGLSWNSAYRAGSDLTLPSTTVVSSTMYLGFQYNSTDSKWDLVGKAGGF